MKTLFHVIYSGETKELNNVRITLTVLAAAVKYQMLTVKKICQFKLKLNVMDGNVLELLNVGEMYNAAKLLQVCIEFIITERSTYVTEKLKEMCLTGPNVSATLVNSQFDKLLAIPSNYAQNV